MIFMESGSVLEFLESGYDWKRCYFSLADSCGLYYYYQVDENGGRGGKKDYQLIVSPEKMEKNIRLMLNL
jgi:hypothetical protein